MTMSVEHCVLDFTDTVEDSGEVYDIVSSVLISGRRVKQERK